MPPPELAADAPVADVLHPVVVDLGEALRDDPDLAAPNGLDGRLGDRRHPHVPLLRHDGLHDLVAPVAVAHGVAVRVDLLQQAVPLQLLDDLGPDGEPVLALVRAGVLIHRAVEVHHVDDVEAVALADIEVVVVVAGSHLEGAGPELGVHGVVGDHGQDAAQHRQHGGAAYQVGVPLVVRVHGYRRVAKQRLRPGRRYRQMVVGVLEPVPQVVEPGALLPVPDLQVGESRRAARAPVHYPLAAVDEPFAVQINERGAHRFAGALIQGEAPARPVARRPQALDLLVDPIAVLVDPLPDQIDERLPAQVVPRLVVRGELPLDHHLGGDAGVVGAGQVEGRVADHPVPADHQVLQRHGQRVPHVELARHVRGRHDDDVGLLRAVDDGREVAALHPEVVDALLHGLGVVRLCHV